MIHANIHFSPTNLQPANPLTKGALLTRTIGDQVGGRVQPAGDAALLTPGTLAVGKLRYFIQITMCTTVHISARSIFPYTQHSFSSNMVYLMILCNQSFSITQMTALFTIYIFKSVPKLSLYIQNIATKFSLSNQSFFITHTVRMSQINVLF